MWWDERGLMGCVPDRPHGRKLKAVVDLDCDYLRSLVLEGFSRRPEWVVQGRHSEEPGEDEAADLRNDLGGGPLLYWGEYERINWSAIERGDQHCNCYCIRKGLIRKAQFAHNLKKWSLKRPEGWIARSLPETHIMDVYHPDYLEEALYDVPER
ncbi:unnamed protein product [Ostreobium quekettii]|uniref:Uncharacterized protein n=1 Tax=Ostreobium quekettii TaxID=121088 RepID=A0A8S1J2V2_9CHLO|nr:unnamed protein product [Ostreobium quekettii]